MHPAYIGMCVDARVSARVSPDTVHPIARSRVSSPSVGSDRSPVRQTSLTKQHTLVGSHESLVGGDVASG